MAFKHSNINIDQTASTTSSSNTRMHTTCTYFETFYLLWILRCFYFKKYY